MDVNLFLYTPRPEDMKDRVRQAITEGFDGLYVAEAKGDPFQTLAVAAEHLRHEQRPIDLGTAVALAFPRSPMVSAVAAWDLHRTSNQRFTLGLGSQVRKHVEQRFSSEFVRPAARLREYTLAVRHIWEAFQNEHPLDFHGEFHHFDFLPASVHPGSLPSVPKLFLAALGPLMFRAAGATADGAFVHPVHTLDYLREVAEPQIRRGLDEAGRARSDFALSVTTFPVVGTGQEGTAALEDIRAQLAFYASTPAYRPVLELHGWQGIGDRLRELVRAGDTETMPSVVPDDMLEAFCIIADTWEDAAALAHKKYEGTVEEVAFHTAPPLKATAS